MHVSDRIGNVAFTVTCSNISATLSFTTQILTDVEVLPKHKNEAGEMFIVVTNITYYIFGIQYYISTLNDKS